MCGLRRVGGGEGWVNETAVMCLQYSRTAPVGLTPPRHLTPPSPHQRQHCGEGKWWGVIRVNWRERVGEERREVWSGPRGKKCSRGWESDFNYSALYSRDGPSVSLLKQHFTLLLSQSFIGGSIQLLHKSTSPQNNFLFRSPFRNMYSKDAIVQFTCILFL